MWTKLNLNSDSLIFCFKGRARKSPVGSSRTKTSQLNWYLRYFYNIKDSVIYSEFPHCHVFKSNEMSMEFNWSHPKDFVPSRSLEMFGSTWLSSLTGTEKRLIETIILWLFLHVTFISLIALIFTSNIHQLTNQIIWMILLEFFNL